MSSAESAPCELLPWDTEFFHCPIARVVGDRLNEVRAMQADAWAEAHRVRCLYFLARADDPRTIAVAEKHRFAMVDIRVTLQHQPPSQDGNGPPSTQFTIRPAQIEDIPRLEHLARTSHDDTRFFRDHHFLRSRAEDLYATWIARECSGRAKQVLVATAADNALLGYISCHLEPTRRTGQIGLLAVAREARGRGIGKQLVLGALDWFRREAAQELTVVTQGANLAALRLYGKCGFIQRDLELWYHKWYPERN